jgi:hypothetical protein
VERNKNFFRKIEISQNLPTFFAEKWSENEGTVSKSYVLWMGQMVVIWGLIC